MTGTWLLSGTPFWACVLGIPIVVLESHMWANTLLSSGCNWPETFLWAGAACQVLGLWPIAEALRKASKLAPDGSVSKRISRWLRDFLAIILPLPRVSGNVHITLPSATFSMRGNATVLLLTTPDVEKRLAQLERFHRETSERLTGIEIRVERAEDAANKLIEGESTKRRAHVEKLRKLFVSFAASGIGWAYAGLVYVVAGTVMVTFPSAILSFACPIP
jgi:hypothetical protein